MSRDPDRRRLLRLMATGLLAGVETLAPRTPAAAGLFPDDGAWRFGALGADGRPLGTQDYRFRRRGGAFEVAVEARLTLPGPAGPLTYRHRSSELWRDGWLYGFESRTRAGAAEHRVSATRDDRVLRGRRDGHAFSISGYVVPSSLWHPDTPRLEALMDSATGRTRVVQARRGPRERVPAGAGTVEATRWRLSGELERVLWYDAARRLARVRFAAPDGSPVVLERAG